MNDAMPILDWVNGDPGELRAAYRAERLKLAVEAPADVSRTPMNGALVFTPPGGGQGAPVLYFHGGSWMVGGPETHQALVGWLCKLSGRVVHSVPYRLAPENPWPAQRDDAHAQMAAMLEDADRAFVCGDSAGGAMALWAAASAPAGRVCGAATFYGAFGVTQSASITRFGPGSDGLTEAAVAAIYRRMAVTSPASLRADMTGGDCPILLLKAERDPLADDNDGLAQELANRDVTHISAAGFGHGFLQMSGRDKAARAYLGKVASWMAAQEKRR